MKFVKLVKAEEKYSQEEIELLQQKRQEIESLASQFGYTVETSNMSNTQEEVPFFKVYLEASNKPDITVTFNDPFGEKGVKIQTTSYGSLNIDDYSEFLKNCQNALACAKAFKEKYNL